VASLATGVLLAVITTYKPWRYGWIAIKGGITLALTGLLLALLVPGLGRAAHAAAATLPHVTHTQRLLYTIAPATAAVLLAVNLTLGRYQPRIRWRVTAAPDVAAVADGVASD
jgi:hypothetical protein